MNKFKKINAVGNTMSDDGWIIFLYKILNNENVATGDGSIK